MALETTTIREHTTAPITMQLLSDSVAIDLSLVYKVRLDLIDATGRVYRYATTDVPAALEITNPVNGEISFTPPSEDVLLYNKQPYKVAVWIWDSPISRYSVPGKDFAIIHVAKEY